MRIVRLPAAALAAVLALLSATLAPPPAAAAPADGCLACHAGVTGLEGPHAPAAIGCAACHAGDAQAKEKAAAHAGMVLVPGNLADAARTCGRGGCHEAIVPRVERSIMSTMAGVIAVDRAALGEPDPPGAPLPHAQRLGHGVADSHLRELCVGCHLGQPKTQWGPVTEESQGGGCNACHLEYGGAAARALAAYLALPAAQRPSAPAAHPSLTLNPRNAHCFGCHSRSGRIALGYEGWHEMRVPEGERPAGAGTPRVRELADGRFVEKVVADVHHERGLECIDCHTANELMGAGAEVARKHQQQRIGCADCHAAKPASVPAEARDPESVKLMALRGWTLAPGERMGTTRDGDPIVNLVVGADGAKLRRKRTGEARPVKAPAAACTAPAHVRVACASCHSAWAPRCASCHTQFDPAGEGFDHAAQAWVKGTWNETAGPFEAKPPTLGVVAGAVETFVPGMVMTFDRNRTAGAKPQTVFRRLYAKLSPHTTRREARACASCHADPVALGYGEGELRFEAKGASGRWRFRPAREPLRDGLPADAWTGFLKDRKGPASTREDARPFTVAGQRRVLTVGACLACHEGDSPVMRRALADFAGTLAARSPKCALPAWGGGR